MPKNPTAPSATEPTLLGAGIYDLTEAARLVGRAADTIARWVRGPEALHQVRDSKILNFLDLISLLVISELVQRRVPKPEIRGGGEFLSRRLSTDYPFAHKDIATAGAAWFGKFGDWGGDWVDVGKGGQLAFQQTIRDYLKPVLYGEDDLASVWKPRPRILINPEVQAGAPCIEGTRVPTRVIAELAKTPEDYPQVASDYRLTVDDVQSAVEYEIAA